MKHSQGGDRMNRKFFNSKPGIRLIALFIAVFLYVFVANENSNYRFQSASNQQFASVNVTETLSNVPVAVGAIDKDMFISGLPESVQVRLTGPRNVLNQVLERNLIVETEDLTNRDPGQQYIRLIIPDLPSSVDYQITPSQRYVRLSTIKTITADVEYEVADDLTSDDYEVKQVEITPTEVELTGDVDIIDQIDRVYINIASQMAQTESFTRSYSLLIEDAEGEILDINADVTEIEVQVTIGRPEKDVRINIVAFGENANEYEYEYAINASRPVVVVGSRSVIDDLETLDYVIDVSDLETSSPVEGTLQIPRGVTLKEELEISVDVNLTPLN